MPRNLHDDDDDDDDDNNDGGARVHETPSVGDLLTARPTGLTEPETWAILCQSVQALQDLFLSDGTASDDACLPLVTPATLLLSTRGRVRLRRQNQRTTTGQLPQHLIAYMAPEYRSDKRYTDTDIEKMWIYGLGETLKRAATAHRINTRFGAELNRVLVDMTKVQPSMRASLMNLLDIISNYCKRRHQNRPFTHIIMDLHQEAMAALELAMETTPWGPPAMPELRPLNRNRTETDTVGHLTMMPRRWMTLTNSNNNNNSSNKKSVLAKKPAKLTKEASTSMEDLSTYGLAMPTSPGSVIRPKSMCVPSSEIARFRFDCDCDVGAKRYAKKRKKPRRNPVQRAASRLYRATNDDRVDEGRDCIGPEFVVRATLPRKRITIADVKGHHAKINVTVIMLNGQKVDVACNPSTTTANQLFEQIIQCEHIEENFMLGLSALIAGDFVFLPSDTRICKAIQSTTTTTTSSGSNGGPRCNATLTLYVRVRFFLPSLRGIRSAQTRHLLYLQLRRSVLEYQLPCTYRQLIELNGHALQAEFGDYNHKEHGTGDYFLLEHYVPEIAISLTTDDRQTREDMIRMHRSRIGVEVEKAEEDFIALAQSLPHYGGHFYAATWVHKDQSQKDVWLHVSAQGINLYERNATINNDTCETFEWRAIRTLCYSKHYLCVLPHLAKLRGSKLKKYKLKMDHKKSYFAFRLASLHHQFFLRMRTEYTSLQSLSQQFGVPLKDMKNKTNSLYKSEGFAGGDIDEQRTCVGAEPEFKIEFRASSRTSSGKSSSGANSRCKRRSRSVDDFATVADSEAYRNGENGMMAAGPKKTATALLLLDSGLLPGDKRRGVKMGTRAFAQFGSRVSRSMEAVNVSTGDDLEQLSLQSVSIHCSTASIPRSPVVVEATSPQAYVLDSTIRSCTNQFLPDFQESIGQSLLDKLNKFSFAEERHLRDVTIRRSPRGHSLGLQITEGSDGKVYVQSVIVGGPAYLTGDVKTGDQIVAVDGRDIQTCKYADALEILKGAGETVKFVVSRLCENSNDGTSRRNRANSKYARLSLSPSSYQCNYVSNTKKRNNNNRNWEDDNNQVEKHVIENCRDLLNVEKYNDKNVITEVPYLKHIRYDETDGRQSRRTTAGRGIGASPTTNDRAVIVDMIPKRHDSLSLRPITLPRSLGLSRKWRGPVKYPVTPVKKANDDEEARDFERTTSDEEQVFI